MSRDTICSGAKLTALADAIRSKTGAALGMTLDEMVVAIEGLSSGGGGVAELVARTGTSIPEADTITFVGECAFARWEALSGEVVLPNAEEMRLNAFDRCSGVTAISAPRCKRIYGIGSCANLERLHLPELEFYMNSLGFGKLRDLHLPECTTFRGTISGAQCKELRRVWLPKATVLASDYASTPLLGSSSTLVSLSLDAIADVHGYSTGYALVSGCSALSSVNLPSAERLRGVVFSGCGSLRSLYLPACTELGHNAIGSGTPVDTLVLPGETPCRLDGTLRNDLPIAQGTGFVYVPASLVEAYRAAAYWSAYAAQVRAIEDWPAEVEAARANAVVATQGWDTDGITHEPAQGSGQE